MRIARKLVLVAMMAVAALALAASTASASVAEVRNEDAGEHCSALTVSDHSYAAAECQINAVGANVELRDFLGIMHICGNNFSGALNETGEGFVYNQVISGCALQPCREADGHATPWPAELTTEGPTWQGTHTMEAVFCVTGPFGIVANCHLNGLLVNQTTHNNGTIRTPGYPNTHTTCEGNTNAVLGLWNITSPGEGIEII